MSALVNPEASFLLPDSAIRGPTTVQGKQGGGGGPSDQGPARLLRRLHISIDERMYPGLPTVWPWSGFTKYQVAIIS